MHLHILKSQQDILPLVWGALPTSHSFSSCTRNNACTLQTVKMKGLLEFRSHHLSQQQQPIEVLSNLQHLLVLLHSPPSSRKWLGPCGAIPQESQLHAPPVAEEADGRPCKTRCPLLQKNSLAARPELLVNNRIYLPLFSFSRSSQTLQLEVLHQHPQQIFTKTPIDTKRCTSTQPRNCQFGSTLRHWFLDVGYQIMPGSSGIKPIILVCVCLSVRVLQTLVRAGPFPEQ